MPLFVCFSLHFCQTEDQHSLIGSGTKTNVLRITTTVVNFR